VDDSLFNSGATGELLMTDQTTGMIYQVTVPAGSSAQVFSTAQDIGELGTTNLATGLFTPVISGLGSPRGLAFLNAGAFTDLSNYTLVDPSTDLQGPNDPNLINDTTTNVLLTEKYDDLKVQAILNEIKGQPSHTFFGSDKSKVPAIFGMNFQAVSVAQKDAHGGINLLPNGQEGAPSALLEAAIQHTDQSIGKIVAALHQAGIWNSTQLYVTAKHGQDPRVGLAGLMKDNTLPDLLAGAGAPVAQATQDNVSLIWLQDQATTAKAVAALKHLKDTGTISVSFQGVAQTLQASQIIDQILAGPDLVKAGLGNPATDSTTPDIIVTLKPGYIWVGNVLSQHKRAEHGGFTEDSTHIALVVSGGALPEAVRGTTVDTPVKTQQIDVSVLVALGLNPSKLTGAMIDHTKALPGLTKGGSGGGKKDSDSPFQTSTHSPSRPATDSVGGKQAADLPLQFTTGQSKQAVVATFFDPSTTNGLNGYTVTIRWGDNSGPYTNAILVRDPSTPATINVYGGHTYDTASIDHGTVQIVTPSGATITGAFTAMVTDSVPSQAPQSFADEVADPLAMGQDLFGGNSDLNL
jgi:hypothetical protein